MTLELLIPGFGSFCCGFFARCLGFLVGWFVCLEVLLWKELFSVLKQVC